MNTILNDYIELFVPGRLCFFGEHSDWAAGFRRVNADVPHGYAIVCGVEQGIRARAKKSNIFKITSLLKEDENPKKLEVAMDYDLLKKTAMEDGFFSYAAGVAAHILENYKVGGIQVEVYEVDLPIKKGLASSAAICVLIARAFSRLYNLQLNVTDEMEIAYCGELLTTSRCGRMDQICAFGKKPRLITFDGDSIEVKPVSIPKPIYWVFADLNKGKDTKRILNDLSKCYPFARDEQDELVQETLGTKNKEIISKVLAAFEAGDACEIGYLMTESQRLFDDTVMPLSFEELSAPKLHSVLNDKNIKKWVWGGKGVGSQGDGAVQFIARGKQEQKILMDYLQNKLHLTAYSLDLGDKKSVRKAVIPLAGYGTRLFPASKSIKKELFPIIDRSGMAKPALLLTLEELDEAGIDEICLVIAEGDEQIYLNLFKQIDNNEYLEKLSPQFRDYDKKLKRLGEKITFVYQNERLGLGHAVYQTRSFAQEEPVLLVLGDHIFISNGDSSCASQAIESFEKNSSLMVLVQEVPLEQVSHYGIVKGEWVDERERNLNVTGIFEKPDIKFAKEHLGIKNRIGNTKYYSVFGQYILTPEVFEVLENNICLGRTENGEFQLTSALDEVRKMIGMYALVPNGQRFDIGLPDAYRHTVWNYGD